MNTNLWLIRREFWENRAIWMIPAVFAALILIGALFGEMSIPALLTPDASHEFAVIFFVIIGLMFYTVMSVYATWYLLDCLYSDRKDRSILFWKSLPISDTQTVVVKLAVGLIVIPLVYFLIADVTALLVAFIMSIRVHSAVGGALWHGSLWMQIQVLWLYVLLTTAIWYLPIAGWLMAVSAWAKRAVMLWSILPPLVLYIIERWFLGSNVVGKLLTQRLIGLPAVAFQGPGSESWHVDKGADKVSLPIDVFHFIYPSGFLSNPQTWIGLVVGVALILLAIQLRMRRTEI